MQIMLIDKDAAVAAIQSALDAVNALPDQSAGDQQAQIDELKAQVADLSGKVEAASASLAAEISKEADLQASKDAVDAKVAKALADLQGA